jgi:tetratricopeptide (TPR) repeat protein
LTPALFFLPLFLGSASAGQTVQAASDPMSSLEQKIAAAEASLREGETQIAESRYRDALLEGWMLRGALAAEERRLSDAKDAFQRASTSAIDAKAALKALAIVHLQSNETAEAVEILSRLAGSRARDLEIVRLLAQALVSNGEPELAVQELEAARAASPEDPELAFLLASGYVRVGKLADAEPLFAEVLEKRPIPQTHVLIGRTYRDFGAYDRARAELEAALAQDPRVLRAHYYLGTMAIMSEGGVEVETAIDEFRKEIALAPDDALANLCLGMSLVEARRCDEALGPLEIAARSKEPPAQAFHYLGQCQLSLDRIAEAIESFESALSRAPSGAAADPGLLGSLHYQLGLAHRKLGATERASHHFEEAERASAARVDRSRERLTRFLADVAEPPVAGSLSLPLLATPLSALSPLERQELDRRVTGALARAYFNLGVIHVREERFVRGAEMLEAAAGVDPAFPKVQSSLGIAWFNAKAYEKATGPLSRAFEADPANASARRMLALAFLNSGAFDKASDLLKDDPGRASDPSLQFAYGLALVRGGQAAEAETVFGRLLAEHGLTSELAVVLGQAHAHQGNYDAAISTLRKALQLDAAVSGANSTLGSIYLKQGRLPEAEAALRAELEVHPGDFEAQQTLATVLELSGDAEGALEILRSILKANPGHADSRYLMGKILLAQGSAEEAVEQLEAAVRIAPEDDNIHYQLARAYQSVGRAEDSEKHFEIFRKLKDERRSRTP